MAVGCPCLFYDSKALINQRLRHTWGCPCGDPGCFTQNLTAFPSTLTQVTTFLQRVPSWRGCENLLHSFTMGEVGHVQRQCRALGRSAEAIQSFSDRNRKTNARVRVFARRHRISGLSGWEGTRTHEINQNSCEKYY